MSGWQFIFDFIEDADFGGGYCEEPNGSQMLQREQLRCLWTAYCLYEDLEPDTARYDRAVQEMWKAVVENRNILGSNDEFDDCDAFDLWMGALLC